MGGGGTQRIRTSALSAKYKSALITNLPSMLLYFECVINERVRHKDENFLLKLYLERTLVLVLFKRGEGKDQIYDTTGI